MANEITTTLLGTNGGLVASVLSDLVLEQLHDPTDLSALMTFIPWTPRGSLTMDVTQDAVPGAYAARTNETTGGISNSAYTTSEFSLAPAGYSRQYELTDLIPIAGGPIQAERVAANLAAGVGLTLTDLLCALFPALANDVGPGTGVDLDVSSMYDAIFQLNSQSVPGPFAAVLYPIQFNDFQSSLRSEAGAAQFQPATADLLALRGPGFKGTWNGVQLFQSDSVTAVGGGADSSGAMFGAGAFAYTLADARVAAGLIPPGLLYMSNAAMVIEMARDQADFRTALIASIFPSVVEAEDLRGVEIISDR